MKIKPLGFQWSCQKDWGGKYKINESPDNIEIYHKKTYEEGGARRLLSIERMAGELFTEEDMQQLPYSKHIVLKGNGYTYFTLVLSDVQNSPDEKLSKE